MSTNLERILKIEKSGRIRLCGVTILAVAAAEPCQPARLIGAKREVVRKVELEHNQQMLTCLQKATDIGQSQIKARSKRRMDEEEKEVTNKSKKNLLCLCPATIIEDICASFCASSSRLLGGPSRDLRLGSLYCRDAEALLGIE